MAIIDKRKQVIENFKEEFSVNGAIEVIEGLGYKVYKEIPVSEAKELLEENEYTILSEKEVNDLNEKVEERIESMLDVATDFDTIVEALKEVGYYVIDEENIPEIESQLKEELKEEIIEELETEITEDKIVETLQAKGYYVIPENKVEIVEKQIKEKVIEELEDKVTEEAIVSSLELKGYVVLNQDEAKKVDEEMKKIIDEKVQEFTESKEEPKKFVESKLENKLGKNKVQESKASKLEKLITSGFAGKVGLSEGLPEDDATNNDAPSFVTNAGQLIDNGITDLTGEENDVTDVAANVDDGGQVKDTNLDPEPDTEENVDGEYIATESKSKSAKLEKLLV